MKNIVAAAFALLLSFSFMLEAQSKSELQDMYISYLKREGFQPEIDSDGDVRFKSEGFTYFIQVNEDDVSYFRLVLANIWPIESEEERIEVAFACDYANAEVKVCKVHMVSDNVWISFEAFLPDPKDFKAIFKRAMNTIDLAKDKYVDRMRDN